MVISWRSIHEQKITYLGHQMVRFLVPLSKARMQLVRFLRSNFVADKCQLVLALKLEEKETNVSVQSHLAKWPQWIITMWPNFRHVKDIESICLCVFRFHDLQICCPTRILISFDCFEEISRVVVGIFARHLRGRGVGVVFDTLVRFQMYFYVVKSSILVVD